MKCICPCGKETSLDGDLMLFTLPISRFLLSHHTDGDLPDSVTCVCVCGATRTVGPRVGQLRETATWFEAHANCHLPEAAA